MSNGPVHQALRTDFNARMLLSTEQADIKCSALGTQEMLRLLNDIFGTSLSFDHSELRALFESFISLAIDFGTLFALVRTSWPSEYELPDQGRSLEVDFLQRLSGVEAGGSAHNSTRDGSISGETIHSPYYIKPRRLWDLYAHRVVPFHYSLQEGGLVIPLYWAISHSWTDDMVGVDTPVNAYEWPVPLPKGMTLEAVRAELIGLGAQYVWLDVLCLRQSSTDADKERKRRQEWSVDVPTIGTVYVSGAFRVVRYMNGLGRIFERCGWDHPRHWLNRAWTLQEMKYESIIGGVPHGVKDPLQQRSDESGELLSERLSLVTEIETLQEGRTTARHFMNIIAAMRRRHSTNPVDKIAGVAMLFHSASLPLYDEAKGEEAAWALCIRHLPPALQAELLFQFEHPGNNGITWCPSWNQLMTTEVPPELFLRTVVGMVKNIMPDGKASYEGPVLTAYVTLQAEAVGSTYRRAILKVQEDEFKVGIPLSVPDISEGQYTLIGDELMWSWVLCITQGALDYRKVTILRMSEAEADRLKDSNLYRRRRCRFA